MEGRFLVYAGGKPIAAYYFTNKDERSHCLRELRFEDCVKEQRAKAGPGMDALIYE